MARLINGVDVEALRAACDAATPGPWLVDKASVVRYTIRDYAPGIDWICSMQVSNQPNFANDAEFIALANPATVRALLEALEQTAPPDPADPRGPAILP